MSTTLILSILLTFSIAICVLLVLYLRNVLARLLFVSENLRDLNQMITNFNNHLTVVYELETFYGDQDLQNLIKHTRTVVNNIIDIQQKYYDDVEVMEDEDYEEDETPQEVE